MKYYALILRKNILALLLTLVFTFGIIGSASARPMFGSKETCNESTCEWFGYKTCQTTTYIFWIGFKSGWGDPEPC